MTNPFMIPQPFANNGNKNDIKDVRDLIDPIQTATWLTGFPPVTMTPEEAGGLPPNGLDMNGVLNAVSQGLVHRQRGERMQFSFAYATSIGGYPKGAIIQSNDATKEFQSLVDNNVADPNTTLGTFWKIYAGDGSVVDGSQTQKGLVQFATPQQVQDKLDIARAVNPSNALSIANSVAFGVGQTMKPINRSTGVEYTNNTPKTITIFFAVQVGTYGTSTAYCNTGSGDVSVGSVFGDVGSGGSVRGQLVIIAPPQAKYKVIGGSIISSSELS